MLELAGYTELAPIHRGQRSLVLRGRRDADGLPVIVKTAATRYPSADDLGRLRREFQLGRRLELGPAKNHAVRFLELAPVGASLALVLEDFGAHSLRDELNERVPSIEAFLDIARALSGCVQALHESRLLHLDINPTNVLLNKNSHELKLCDFSSGLDLSLLERPPPRLGSPIYASPEQTLRTGRAIDDRSDLYSLGVTLFELLTGELPFRGGDALETVHRHLSALPASVHALRPDTPPTLSHLLLKLLSKDPDERYRSAHGLSADLTRISEALRGGAPAPFELGHDDRSPRLAFSARKYGREREFAELRARFKHVVQGETNFVVVSGEPGVGKSSFVEQLRAYARDQGAQFYSGKFETLRDSPPHAAFAGAFRAFLHRLLTRPSAELRRWRQRLNTAVGPNGQLLIRLVPELERVIGSHPAPPLLDPEQSKARFSHLLLSLFDSMGTPESPLVLFLDDLQWADPASLELIEQLLTANRVRHLLLITAYRSTDVDATHPVTELLERLSGSGGATEIALTPLDAGDVLRIVADALQSSGEQCLPLAQVVWQKTRGNPFFVAQFLHNLESERLLRFDASTRHWQWDLQACQEQVMTNNVVDLMVRRIERLDVRTRELLRHAACIGSEFDASMLSGVLGASSPEALAEALAPALATEILTRVMLEGTEGQLDQPSLRLRFAHDQMQQAAYTSIPEHERAGIHLRIGRALLASCDAEQRQTRVYELLDHFSRGLPFVHEGEEKLRIAELCLMAGQRARASNAHAAAARHLTMGLGLLGRSPWTDFYELTSLLHQELAQSSYVVGDTDTMSASCAQILTHARGILEEVPAYTLELLTQLARSDQRGAITVAREVLSKLGVALPRKVNKASVALRIARLSWRLRHETPEITLARPRLTDERVRCAMQILSLATTPAYLSSPLLFPVVIAEMLNLSLDYGVSEWTGEALVGWGAVQMAGFGALERGYAIGSSGPRLIEKLAATRRRAQIQTTYNMLIRHWLEPLHSTLEPLASAVQEALEHGNLPYAAIAGVTHTFYMLMAGRPLAEVEQRTLALQKQLLPLGQRRFASDQARRLQLVHCLQGRSPEPKRLRGEFYDDAVALAVAEASGDRADIAAINYEQGLLQFVHDDPAAALASCTIAFAHADSVLGTVYPPALEFLAALAQTRLLSQRTKRPRFAALSGVRRSLKRLERWAQLAPSNHSHRVALIQAELCALRADPTATVRYETAITLAERNGYVHELAMTLECAGRFHVTLGQSRIAGTTLLAAREAWQSWGANAKVGLLDAEFSRLLFPLRLPVDSAQAVPAGVSHGLELMDVGSLIKACQAIASEIRLPRLARRLLELSLENTGAQRGLLFLNQAGKMSLSASASVDDLESPSATRITTGQSEPDESLPIAIVDYVARLGQPLVEDDVGSGALFADDPYVMQERALSVLCVPLASQGVLKGVLYLENNRMRGAFSANRTQVLRLLSALSAIAMENASLYANVEQAHALETERSRAQSRFVPAEFLRNLGRASITDVELGDNVRKDMSVLFSDVRDFTRLIESMSPERHIGFINRYLGHMEPAIVNAGGFVDSYVGDGIMALFEGDSDRALEAVVAMSRELFRFNSALREESSDAISMGVGVSSGALTLGTIGGPSRIKCGVIGDPVNLASRLESLTKTFRCFALIAESTRNSLRDPQRFELRMVDRVRVKGKLQPITLFELLDAEPPKLRDAKSRSRARFDEALMLFFAGNFKDAGRLAEECLELCAPDGAARQLSERCQAYQRDKPPSWDGIHVLTEK